MQLFVCAVVISDIAISQSPRFFVYPAWGLLFKYLARLPLLTGQFPSQFACWIFN